MINFGRAICGDPAAAASREWLVTNGIGGFASGTIAGVLTRRYHGLLVAALNPPLGRTLLLTRLDEEVDYDGQHYPLFASQWSDGTIEPQGFHYLERFHLEGSTPVWSYALGDALLEKRVWMQPHANTSYISYTLRRATQPLHLKLRALVNYRDYHATSSTEDWQMQITPLEHGLQVSAGPSAVPFVILSDCAEVQPCHEWSDGYFLSVEAERGLSDVEAHLCVGEFRATLQPGALLTIVASSDPAPARDGTQAYAQRQAYEQALLARLNWTRHPAVQQLALAADQFIVARKVTLSNVAAALPATPGKTVIAGYPWFSDWGRDTMISLPGLTLPTGRAEDAAMVLRTFAHFVDRGMLPNRFPDLGETPEYNTVDATLWYFEAIRAYHAATGDDRLLHELFPVLAEIIAWHQQGTRYGIKVDPADGLLAAGEPGVQLTWMDVKIDDWVVTPRSGKPVEINALWYNALHSMAAFALRLGQPADAYSTAAARVGASFTRFWNRATGYCFDVIDGPDGDDPTLRPNQIFAVALPHSPLDPAQQRAVVDICARRLLTSHGLRSLDPAHPDYVPHYLGSLRERDAAYHQGTVWGWLIGPFVSAHLRVYGDKALARSFLLPLVQHLAGAGIGSISEIFDAAPPFTPRGCIAQAWSVAELLRAWQATETAAEVEISPR